MIVPVDYYTEEKLPSKTYNTASIWHMDCLVLMCRVMPYEKYNQTKTLQLERRNTRCHLQTNYTWYAIEYNCPIHTFQFLPDKKHRIYLV